MGEVFRSFTWVKIRNTESKSTLLQIKLKVYKHYQQNQLKVSKAKSVFRQHMASVSVILSYIILSIAGQTQVYSITLVTAVFYLD